MLSLAASHISSSSSPIFFFNFLSRHVSDTECSRIHTLVYQSALRPSVLTSSRQLVRPRSTLCVISLVRQSPFQRSAHLNFGLLIFCYCISIHQYICTSDHLDRPNIGKSVRRMAKSAMRMLHCFSFFQKHS